MTTHPDILLGLSPADEARALRAFATARVEQARQQVAIERELAARPEPTAGERFKSGIVTGGPVAAKLAAEDAADALLCAGRRALGRVA